MWKLRNGENISFWLDNWIENKNLIKLLDVDRETIPSPQIKVSDFIQQDITWNLTKLTSILGNHPIIHKIQGIAIPVRSKLDSFC